MSNISNEINWAIGRLKATGLRMSVNGVPSFVLTLSDGAMITWEAPKRAQASALAPVSNEGSSEPKT